MKKTAILDFILLFIAVLSAIVVFISVDNMDTATFVASLTGSIVLGISCYIEIETKKTINFFKVLLLTVFVHYVLTLYNTVL